MRTRPHPRALIVGLLGCLALASFISDAHAAHAWGSYHWARTSNPFTLKLGENLSSVWDPYLVTTSSDWSLSTVLDTTIVSGGTIPRSCRPTIGRVEVCNSKYGDNGWLGLAQIWVSGSHITQGVVKMNDTYFNTPTYNTSAWRHLVMCQEVGHTLGLDHQDTNFGNGNLGTCMDYTSNPDGPPPNEQPNAHDYEQLETIYAHLDSTTTLDTTAVNKMPPAMTDIDFATPAQWGTLLRTSHGGRTALYELDFGRGHRVFTFVIWAQ